MPRKTTARFIRPSDVQTQVTPNLQPAVGQNFNERELNRSTKAYNLVVSEKERKQKEDERARQRQLALRQYNYQTRLLNKDNKATSVPVRKPPQFTQPEKEAKPRKPGVPRLSLVARTGNQEPKLGQNQKAEADAKGDSGEYSFDFDDEVKAPTNSAVEASADSGDYSFDFDDEGGGAMEGKATDNRTTSKKVPRGKKARAEVKG